MDEWYTKVVEELVSASPYALIMVIVIVVMAFVFKSSTKSIRKNSETTIVEIRKAYEATHVGFSQMMLEQYRVKSKHT